MFSVILLVIIALGFGYFATQNSLEIPITFANMVIPHVPLYIVLGVTLLIGLLFSWILSLVNSFLFSMNLRGKEHTIEDIKKTNEELNQRIIQLEIENTKLIAKLDKDSSAQVAA
jgi:hypothetical protein